MRVTTEPRIESLLRAGPIAAVLATVALLAGIVVDRAEAAGQHGFGVDVGTKTAPLVAHAPAGGAAEVRFKVNGRGVPESEILADGPRRRFVRLSASDGLAAGRNTIQATVTAADGASRRAKTTVRLTGRDLLADAGDDVGAIVAAPPVSLGTKALATRGVEHRWQVVEAPRGATYKLEGSTEPRPTLSAETPGTYRLQLSSSKGRRGQAAHDTVTVSVSPNDPPLGAPLTTIAADGAIRIGGESYGAGGDIAWVVLERSTRAVVESGTAGRTDAGMSTLSGLVDKYTAGTNYQRYLMIVSGRTGLPAAQQPAFASIAMRLGSPVLSEENFAALKASLPFTLAGVPGGARGAATTRIPGGNAIPVSGSIEGYLQKNQAVAADGTQLYDLATREHLSYDTRSVGTGTSNTMRINGEDVGGSLPAGATAGLHVVVYESFSMRRVANMLLTTNAAGGSDRTRQADAAAAMKKAFGEPGAPLVFVQTIGKPKAAGPEWAQVVKQLSRVGANANYVNALDGTTEYAAVGTVNSTVPPAEASTAWDHGPYGDPQYPAARLKGIVARGRDSRLVPTIAGTPTPQAPDGGINSDLIATAWQSPTAFPQLAPAASEQERKAVSDYVCKAVGFCQPTNSCPEIRACYWQRYSADWNQKLSLLTALGYQAGQGFTPAQLDSVKAQLTKEFAAVANVETYIERLQRPFEKSGSRSYVDLKLIGDEIFNGLQRPPETTKTPFVLDLISKALKLGNFLGPPGSAIATGLSAAFEVGAFLSKDRDGQPVLGAEVRARSDQLGKEIFQRIDAANQQLDQIGLLFVSDYGKLLDASAKIDAEWALPASDASALNQLTTASKQWFYTALVPTAYPYLIRGNATNARAMDCWGDSSKRAWPNQPDDAQMYGTVGYDAGGNAIKSIFFFARGLGGAMSPPDGLGKKIFAPRVGPTTGLGIEKLEFFTPRVFGGAIAHAVNGETSEWCRVGWLPKEW